jgi:hypothetical protein
LAAAARGNETGMNMMTEADLADDAANYVMTEYEQGRRDDNVVAEAEYPCGCKAQRVSTIAGWQWVDAPDCDDDKHRARAGR